MTVSELFSRFAESPRAVLRRCGFDITRFPPRRQRLEKEVARLTRNAVASGLFAGLLIPDEESWGEYWPTLNDWGPKLLGFYELELQPALEDVVQSASDVIINVGCGDGYYALGLARLLPNAKIVAYDTDEVSRKICDVGRALNNLKGDIQIGSYCSAEELKSTTQLFKRPFALIDCEGGERQLLLGTDYQYANTRMIIECHDNLDPNITHDLIQKFSKTHVVELIEQGARNPFTSEVTKGWPENDLWLLVSERRLQAMHWLHLKPL